MTQKGRRGGRSTFKGVKPLGLFLVVILALSLIIFGHVIVSAAVSPYSPAEAISIVPASKIYESDVPGAYNNTQFTVDVIVTNITGCAGYQFKIAYNATLLKVMDVTLDTGTPLTPSQMAPASNKRIDTNATTPGSGYIQWATVWTSGTPVYTYSGNSTAARITFKIIYSPPQVTSYPQENTTVSSGINFDATWTRGVDDLGDDIFFSKFNNGFYAYTTIGLVPGIPVADFSYAPTFPFEGEEVVCTDQSQPNGGTINTWLWEIQGPATNTTAMDGSVMKFFGTGGGYVNVTLTVWDTEGVNANVTKQIFVSARGHARLFVLPPESTTTLEGTFRIGIIINYAVDLINFEFKLSYNTTVLDVVSVWVMWPDPYVINETEGFVWVNASCPFPYPFSGNGTMAVITFKAVEVGNSPLDLYDTKLVDFYARRIPHDVFNGYVTVTPIHDVALIEVTPSATQAYSTWIMPISITVVTKNEGNASETFNVAVYYNQTATTWALIGNQTVTNLVAGANKTLTFSWTLTGVPPGLYAIKGTASIVTDEIDTEDNTLTSTSTVKMKIPGDVDGDWDVDVGDQRKVQIAMFSTPGSHNWNPEADIDGDGDVEVSDQRIQQNHMFETWP